MPNVQMWQRIPYYTVKASNILDISAVYTDVATLDIPVSFEAGKYEFKFSFSFTLDSVTNSMQFRWRTDGGTWSEIELEPKDVSNINPVAYFYPEDYTAGSHLIEAEMRKTGGGDTLNLLYLDLVLVKVGS